MLGTFGARVREQRKRVDLTQVQLAEAVGVAPSAVNAWENDQRSPDSVKTLLRLSDVLESSVDYLLTGKEPPGVAWIVAELRALLEDAERVQRGTFAESDVPEAAPEETYPARGKTA